MNRIKSILLAIAIATTASMLLSSCQEEAPEINYTMNVSVTNDFSEVVEAINNGNLKNDAAISELVKAIDKLSGDQQTKLQIIIDALASMNITLNTRLAAIEAAMKAQTLSLEGKLDLLEAAVRSGLADNKAALELIRQAIASLPDYTSQLEAIETAIKSQTASLETKLALIEAAVKDGFADDKAALELIRQAIDSLPDYTSQLEAIEAAIKSQTASLETKLALIEAAMKAQTLSLEGKLDLLKTAIENLPDYSSQLEAIETAIASLPDYTSQLEAIEAAISALPDYSSKFDAVVSALNGIKAQAEALATGQTGIATEIGNVVSAIKDLTDEVNSGNTDAATALALIIRKLEDLKTAIENIEAGSGNLPKGTLSGKFSVGAGRQVQFSKGNLQATYDGNNYSWGFAAHQYDFVGKSAGNTTIDSQTNGSVVDLFGWSTAATNYGINTSTNNADYSGDFVDWGKNIGDGSTWRTLSKDEWTYLFQTRTNASSLYKYGVTVCGKTNCLIIAPDGFTGSIASSYDASTWPAAEAAGLVCLPAAGGRRGSSVDDVGDGGFYWSSSADGSSYAYYVFFYSSPVYPHASGNRRYGFSVRLITDVAGSAPEGPAHEDPLSGKFSVSSTKKVQFSKGNLQATYDGSKYTWGFADSQYDFVGKVAGNTTIDSQTRGSVVDLFGWSTASNGFGIITSSSDSDYYGDLVDWGKNIGDGGTWRTLTIAEWRYLFETRTNAASLYKTGVTVCGKSTCLIIAPDGYTGTIDTSYDASTWPAAEATGLVCLPAAGARSGSSVSDVGGYGIYWSSSAFVSNFAYYVYFDSSNVTPAFNVSRYYGYSVRLITDAK